MNFKSAITTQSLKHETQDSTPIWTCYDPVIKYSKWGEGKPPQWIKISLVYEHVPIVPRAPPSPSTVSHPDPPLLRPHEKTNGNILSREMISLEKFVKLQEKRMAEYDATRWRGAYRETFPLSFQDPTNAGVAEESSLEETGEGSNDCTSDMDD